MSNDTPLTLEQIDEMIKALQEQKRSMNKNVRIPRTPRTKKEQKQVRHQRQVLCSYCGNTDKKTNMERISRYEYQHPMCIYREPKQVRIEFKL